MKNSNEPKDQYPEKETAQRRDKLLGAAMKISPKDLNEKGKTGETKEKLVQDE